MEKGLLLQTITCLLIVSCTVKEMDTKDAFTTSDEVFYASLESYSDADTKVYVDENVKILWDEDDRITIFNKYTYNQEYRFTGETGDNAGAFKKIPNDDFVTGNSLDHIFAIYPFLETTKISNKEVMTVTLPAEQLYREGSFGPGANVMTSATDDNNLMFKNVGGYLVLKFYGEGVSVSSIKLEGNNGELISGKSTITQTVGGNPTVQMTSTAETSVTLTCNTPVELGATKEEATQFWMVVPPTTFTKGFKLTVTDPDGRVFVKETDKNLTIARNGLLRISPIEVVLADSVQPNNVIYYTSSDGSVITPYATTNVFGANIVSNEYKDGQGIITFDGKITHIGDYAFYNCASLSSIIIPNRVTSIGMSAFRGCSSLASVSIPDSVSSIDSYAFGSCNSLTSVIIPNGVTTMPEGLFAHCSSLSSVILPETITNIEGFSSCSSLTSITIPDSVTRISSSAFYECTSLESITIPKSVNVIGNFSFYGCSSLTNITIPQSVSTIGSYAFAYCDNLSSVSILPGVSSIGQNAFTHCPRLTSIIIPEGVTSIQFRSFDFCTGLVSVTLPSSVTSIDDYAFYHCDSLVSISIPDSVTSIGERAFYECDLTAIIIPNGITSIKPYTFFYNNRLSSVILPESLREIGEYAFFGFCNTSGQHSLTIPESVESIGQYAFGESGLSSLIVESIEPPIVGYSILSHDTQCQIYVPRESVDAYKTATNWSEYADRIQVNPSFPITFADDAVKDICVSKWDTNGDGELSLPEAAAVTSLSYDVFSGNTVITSFDEFQYFTGITAIPDGAFDGCHNLTSIIIPESITDIYGYALYGVPHVYFNGLTAPVFHKYSDDGDEYYACFSNDAVLHVKPEAYSSFTSTKRDAYVGNVIVDVPNNEIWYISSNNGIVDVSEFSESTPFGANLTSNTYSNGIGRMVFDAPVSKVGRGAFKGADGLLSVFLPEPVKSISSAAFAYCPNLNIVSLPLSVETIGWATFESCGLQSIVLPSFARIIDDSTQPSSNPSLIPFNLSYSMQAVFQNGKWQDRLVQDNVLIEVLPNHTSVTIYDVPTIGPWAAGNCNKLQSVIIGQQCTVIGASAFMNCTSLTSIRIEGYTPPQISTDVFDNTNNCQIKVPASVVNTYKTAWPKYSSRIVPL